MNALAINPMYSALLTKVPPRVVRSEEQNEAYIEALYKFEQRQESWGVEEADLADLLTLLIENFEERRYALPKASPVEVIRFLMDQHGLKQKDLVDVFGTASVASEVLRGKRELTKEQIRRLAERFGVSVALFF